MVMLDIATETADAPEVTADEEVEFGECPSCGPDQESDADGHCSWCGRPLATGPDFRSDPDWWRS